MLNFNISAFIQSKKYLWSKENKIILDKKTYILLTLLILSIGIILPIYPLYTTIAILFISSVVLALLHEFALLLFLIICFSTSYRIGESFLPFSFSMAETAIYILIFIYFRDIVQIDFKRLVKEPIVFAFFIFILSRILSAAIHLSGDTSHMLSIMRDSSVPILSFLVSVVMFRKFGLKKILLCWIFIGGLLAILGIIQSNTGKFLFYSHLGGERQRNYLELLISGTIGMGRSCTGLFDHPNPFSLYMQQILMLSLVWYLLSKQKFERIIMLAISGLLLITIFYTFSRGGYVTVFISITALMFLYSKKTRIIGIGLTIIMILFTIFVILPYFFIYYEQFQTLFYRFFLWQSGLKILKNNPAVIFIGIGPGNFMEKAGTVYTAHNVYLLYLVENGIFVLLSLLYFIIVWLKHLLLKYYKTKELLGKVLYLGLFTGSSGYFIHEIIEHTFYGIKFLSIFGFWMGLISQYEKEYK
jgi:putative inorganic carbon (HCO3(-)) transporter